MAAKSPSSSATIAATPYAPASARGSPVLRHRDRRRREGTGLVEIAAQPVDGGLLAHHDGLVDRRGPVEGGPAVDVRRAGEVARHLTDLADAACHRCGQLAVDVHIGPDRRSRPGHRPGYAGLRLPPTRPHACGRIGDGGHGRDHVAERPLTVSVPPCDSRIAVSTSGSARAIAVVMAESSSPWSATTWRRFAGVSTLGVRQPVGRLDGVTGGRADAVPAGATGLRHQHRRAGREECVDRDRRWLQRRRARPAVAGLRHRCPKDRCRRAGSRRPEAGRPRHGRAAAGSGGVARARRRPGGVESGESAS